MPLNVEFKARCQSPGRVRSILRENKARFAGMDHQTDVYFNIPSGRLKLRVGDIERNLIYYRRTDSTSPKKSEVLLFPCPDPDGLHALLESALGVRCIVRKQREIYFHENTKIHVDEVPGLGSFVEVEVIADSDEVDTDSMHATCSRWMRLLGVNETDLVSSSYSDMIDAEQLPGSD